MLLSFPSVFLHFPFSTFFRAPPSPMFLPQMPVPIIPPRKNLLAVIKRTGNRDFIMGSIVVALKVFL